MLESAWTHLAQHGRLGMVVPSGIAFDDFSMEFFQNMVRTERLVSLFDFENRAGLFKDVDRRMRFCLITLSGHARPHIASELAFYLVNAEELGIPGRKTKLSLEDIELLNPNTGTCPIFRTSKDAELCKAIYRRWPILVREDCNRVFQVWNVQFGRIFNLGHEGDKFHDRTEIVGNEEIWLPLYEGKMFDAFNHRAGSVIYRSQNQTRPYQSEDSTNTQLENPNYTVASQFYLTRVECAERITPLWGANWLIAAKDVTSSTNERTLVACLLPFGPTSYSVRILLGTQIAASEGAFLLGFFNAFAADWIVRQFLGGLHLQDNITKQLPILPPAMAQSLCSWDSTLDVQTWTKARVLELTYTAWDLAAFARDCGFKGLPFRWDGERRFLLRCELDAAFFHLYLPTETNGKWKMASQADGCPYDETPEQVAELKRHFPTPRDAVAYIMETFPIVKRKDEQKHGKYRTKRVILEIYDAMAEAMRTGKPYQTLLDPPPADPRVAHPPRATASEEQ